MGLLDEIARQMLSGQTGTGPGAGQGQGQGPGAGQGQPPDLAALLQGVMAMLGDDTRSGSGSGSGGGLQDLIAAFQRSGLGDIISSWIAPGQNQPISPSQLEQALGRDRVGQLSNEAGLSGAQALGALAQLLPVIIDRLTPQGQPPAQGDLGPSIAALLGSLQDPEGTRRA